MPLRADLPLPSLSCSYDPPAVVGTAALTTAAMHGMADEALAELIDRSDPDPAAQLFDLGILRQLTQRRDDGLALLDAAVSASPLFRVRRPSAGPGTLRLLALAGPGDLMVNTPLDFITNHLDVRLDILFVSPGHALPEVIPDHDVMFVAVSEAEPRELARIRRLCAAWPRPVLNEPAALPLLARDALSRLLDDQTGLYCPTTVQVSRAELGRLLERPGTLSTILPGGAYPLLLRPLGSHAGTGLVKLQDAKSLAEALAASQAKAFYLSRFIDYRSSDGLFRKYRVVFIEGVAYLCHMAVSAHWMVHYLNAGMTSSEQKRADEARAMLTFPTRFAMQHRLAFAELCRSLPFDVFSIDCAELPNGRLLVFEADTAAIIHAMDPVELFPYKHVQMRTVFDAFGGLLKRKAESRARVVA